MRQDVKEENVMIIKLRNGCIVIGNSKAFNILSDDYYNAYLAYQEYFPDSAKRCKIDCIRLNGKLDKEIKNNAKII